VGDIETIDDVKETVSKCLFGHNGCQNVMGPPKTFGLPPKEFTRRVPGPLRGMSSERIEDAVFELLGEVEGVNNCLMSESKFREGDNPPIRNIKHRNLRLTVSHAEEQLCISCWVYPIPAMDYEASPSARVAIPPSKPEEESAPGLPTFLGHS
jgi:hypothetical protein